MGCMCSNVSTEDRSEEPLNEESVVKQYSWDKRESIRQRDNVVSSIQGLTNETVVRVPGSSCGQQIIIRNCQKCFIYILDNLSSVLVEDCKDCQMFLGPTETSVIFKDCESCKVLSASQQFHCKTSQTMDFFICCATRPIIENSRNLKFACFLFYYPQLEGWLEPKLENIFTVPECFEGLGVKLGGRDTIVPYMPSKKNPPSEKSCLVMFFNDGLSHDRARTFIKLMRENHTGCSLVQGRELVLKEIESSEIFNSDKYTMAVKQGPVICLEYCGVDCRHFCQETLVAVSKGSTGLVFISAARDHAQKQVEAFRRLAESKLGNVKTPENFKKRA
ncbi:hypothetical protein HELRODRAFT_168788 [Helobdella robusta]|uniref:Protein XRP2 n=1 Tax=Helobdella robusta TaxID=6412 RepID=T1F0Z1_HELRO|nr:hypothetical protein HELRODRAFT_168788 [Helobdella robusta]ESO08870.1 hypothetical protein HELRODRAFT_168788 [Helobdella robusta]